MTSAEFLDAQTTVRAFFFSPPNRKVCIPPPSALSEKLFVWIARRAQIYACGSRGPCHQGLINSDTGWQFSCCADVFRHTCAGDWRAFKVVTFLLWKYPFSCETALSAAICQGAGPTACAVQLQHLEQQQAEVKVGFLHQTNLSRCDLLDSQTLLGATLVRHSCHWKKRWWTAGCPQRKTCEAIKPQPNEWTD